VLGIASGLAAGFAVLAMRHDLRRALNALTGRDFFPQDIYFLSEIPAHLQVSDLISIVGLALLLCSAAALLPAWSAARLDPARALRQ
jgi:lipoprotein-releasing system permease protein